MMNLHVSYIVKLMIRSKNALPFFPRCLYGDDEIVLMDNVVLNDGFEMLPKLDLQDLKTAK